MMNYFLGFFRCLSLLMLSTALHVDAATPPDVRLSGHVPSKALDKAFFLKKLDAAEEVPVTFVLPLRNQGALEKLVHQIYDPADVDHYGKYLSTEDFIEQFAPTQEDYDKVIAYAKTLGLTVRNEHSNRTLLNVTGRVKSIERAFKLTLNEYQTAAGRKFHAPNKNPKVPRDIAAVIRGVVGLDNLAVWRSFNHQKDSTDGFQAFNASSNAFPSGPGGGYSPFDLLTAYNLAAAPADGSGQAIALFELAGYQASDINAYTTHFGLPSAKLHNVLVDGGPSPGSSDGAGEVTLDIQLAFALAPESQIYVYEGPNSNQGVLDTYNRIATDNVAKQVSTSWGLAEDLVSHQYLQSENAIFIQMAAQGQTIYAAAGDSGAYDDANNSSPAVDDPASQPYVVGVGGTRLTVNPTTGAYESEACWDDGFGNGAGGGGVSTFWPIPSWQAKVSTAYSKSFRNVPDVSLNADPNTGYAIYYNGKWTIYGGTSCAAPLWAAFTARVNQKRVASQLPVLGFANPLIYSLGAEAISADFHDVTAGNNLYYPAKTGYDNATGWGSFNGANLFASLTNGSPIPPPPQLSPLLAITMSHNAPFTKGKIGIYHIKVSNQGSGPTAGSVNVTIALPNGLRYRSFSGSGWVFNNRTQTFTRNNALTPGSSYPSIILQVNVDPNASQTVIPKATVSGGGAVSSSVTNLTTTI